MKYQSIPITQFSGYTYASFLEFLHLSKHTFFEIIVLKHFSMPEDSRNEISFEYLSAMFIGHKLSEVSHNFSYTCPSDYSRLPFTFTLETKDFEKLAETLVYIIAYIDDEGSDIAKFVDNMLVFWDDITAGKIKPVCHGLWFLLNQSVNESEGE